MSLAEETTPCIDRVAGPEMIIRRSLPTGMRRDRRLLSGGSRRRRWERIQMVDPVHPPLPALRFVVLA